MQVDINKIVGGKAMFENVRSGNIGKQLELLSYYTNELNCAIYQAKIMKDFIPNIQLLRLKDKTYMVQLDNIQYQYYFGGVIDVNIYIDNILIYSRNDQDEDTWLHKTPKAMLDKIKEHSKIFQQYNKNIKEYLKNNSDYIIEQKKLNKIFNESR